MESRNQNRKKGSWRKESTSRKPNICGFIALFYWRTGFDFVKGNQSMKVVLFNYRYLHLCWVNCLLLLEYYLCYLIVWKKEQWEVSELSWSKEIGVVWGVNQVCNSSSQTPCAKALISASTLLRDITNCFLLLQVIRFSQTLYNNH